MDVARRFGSVIVSLIALGAWGCSGGSPTPEESSPPPVTGTPTAELTAPPSTPTSPSGTPTVTAPDVTATAPGGTPTATPAPTPTQSAGPTATPPGPTPTETGVPCCGPSPTDAPTSTPTPAAPTPTASAEGELFFSQYTEGPFGFNKAVEIYNPRARAVDLSEYALWRISNGGNWPEASLTLSGTLAPGDVVVIANPQADDPGIVDHVDITDDIISFNGDDAIGLVRDGVVLDAVGASGDDPGVGWPVAGLENGTRDHNMIRKASVTGPNPDWPSSAGTSATDSEWILLPSWSATLFGSHPHPGVVGTECEDGRCKMLVPAGPFVRGACGPASGDFPCTEGDLGYNLEAQPAEAPPREISLSAYRMDQTEVTIDEFALCVAGGACEAPSPGAVWCNFGAEEDRTGHPINCVERDQAEAYCAWVGGRLPTEAEWEKAARGGCEVGGDRTLCEAGEDDRPYPWGDDEPTCGLGNIKTGDGFCRGGTAPVGTYASGVSPYGLLDAAGNVREWVADWYDFTYYDPDFAGGSPAQDPQGPASSPSSVKVERGGDFGSLAPNLRTSARSASSLTADGENYGFRCAYDL